MIGTASASSAAATGGGGGGLDDINLYDISAEDMLDIWGDHHMDTAAEVGRNEQLQHESEHFLSSPAVAQARQSGHAVGEDVESANNF